MSPFYELHFNNEEFFEALAGERAVQTAALLIEIIATSADATLLQTTTEQLLKFDGLRPEHAPRLIQTLESGCVDTRRLAARALRMLAWDTRLPSAPLLKSIGDSDPGVRAYVALALLQNGDERSAAEACLRSALAAC